MFQRLAAFTHELNSVNSARRFRSLERFALVVMLAASKEKKTYS